MRRHKSNFYDRYDGYILNGDKFIHNGYHVNHEGEHFHSNQGATYTYGVQTIGDIRRAKRHKVSRESKVGSRVWRVNGSDLTGDSYGS